MKTKAIVVIMVLVLCTLLSSPVFANTDHTFDATGDWSAKGSWDGTGGGKVPDEDTDRVHIEVAGVLDVTPTFDVAELHMDTGVAAGTLAVGSGKTLTVLDFVVMGAAKIGSQINIASGGTVVVGGANSKHAVEFPANGSSTTTQINVDGLLELYAGAEDSSEHNKFYRYVIKFASGGSSIASIINVSDTGVMKFHPTSGSIPAIDHQDNSAGPITVDGNGYIVYVGCDAMDMIDEDADDHGGVFKGTTPPTPQKYTPADVTTEAMAYDQDTTDGIAWFYDGTDTYLFPCKLPDGMTTIDAGDGGSRNISEGAIGVPMDSTLTKASDDAGTYTYLWECDPSEGVTYDPNPNVADPNVSFQSSGTYTLKVTATRTPTGYDDPAIVDWVTYSIDYTRAKIMTTHLAIDAGELQAAEDNNWSNFPRADAEYFKDSSLEGNPENHHMVTYGGDDGWSDVQGVVGCGDNDAIRSDDDGSIQLYLNHQVSGFNEGAAHLDNIDTAITVALWYRGEDDKSQVLIEKEDTFSLELDNNDDKIQVTIWYEGGGSSDFTSKNNDEVGGLSSHDLSFRDDSGDEENWHHLAFSYDSENGVQKIYADGVMIKDDSTTPGKRIATHPGEDKFLHLGGIGGTDDLRRGALDDIRIYNYVLEDYEVAELAAMGESVAMLNAGSNMTVNPADLPLQLDGVYIKLGRGSVTISNGNGGSSNPDERIGWSMSYGSGTATFSNSSDPRSTVTFTEPGTKVLRLTAYERFCGNSNDHYDGVTITVLDPNTCAGYLALGGDPGDTDDDCDVDADDLGEIIGNWMNVSYP